MTKVVNSGVFGEIRVLEEEQGAYRLLRTLVNRYPANAFSILNKKLNEKGLMCNIVAISELKVGE